MLAAMTHPSRVLNLDMKAKLYIYVYIYILNCIFIHQSVPFSGPIFLRMSRAGKVSKKFIM